MSSDFVPPLHAEFRYRVDYVGEEKNPVLVIDNFLDKAELLIEVAERYCQFGDPTHLYPGVQALVPEFYAGAMYTHLRHIICNTFNILSENITHSKSFFSMVIAPPASLQPAQSRPHVDSPVRSQFAAIHYLCSADKGGTSLYRHRATGFEMVDDARMVEMKKYLLQEEDDPHWMGQYINGSNKYYEQIASYDAVFNRIIMYRGNSLHSGNISPDFNFDPNPRTGRLTLNTFINSLE